MQLINNFKETEPKVHYSQYLTLEDKPADSEPKPVPNSSPDKPKAA